MTRQLAFSFGVTLLMGCAAQSVPDFLENEPHLTSAKALGHPACPAEMRAASPQIEPTSDWRVVIGDGFRYCVPGDWATDQPPKPGNAVRWASDTAGLLVFSHLTFAGGFVPVDAGTEEQVFIGRIGGASVRMWTSRPEAMSLAPSANGAAPRTLPPPHVIASYVAWAQHGVMLKGSAKTARQALNLRTVARTFVFTDTLAR